jgi:hypothetical protein
MVDKRQHLSGDTVTVSSDVLATTLSDLRAAKGDRKKMASIAFGKTKKPKKTGNPKETKKY